MSQEIFDLDKRVAIISNKIIADIVKGSNRNIIRSGKHNNLKAFDNFRTLSRTIHQLLLSNPKPIEYILENEEGTPLHTLLTLFIMIERFYNGDITDFISGDQFFIRDLLLGEGQVSGDNPPTIPL